MNRFVVLSGCSGGGKSTLLAELSRRGHPTVEEPGRRVVAQEIAAHGTALAWSDPEAFARRAVDVALADLARVDRSGRWAFFDRGLVDAVTALRHARADVEQCAETNLRSYHSHVFLTPPWREIWASDTGRRHSFGDAVAEHERLTVAYRSLGYELVTVPRLGVAQRADFVMDRLGRGS